MATAPYFFLYSSAATYHHPFPIGFPTAYTPASAVYPPPPPAPTPTPSTAPSAFGARASGSPPIPPPPAYPYAANHAAPFPYPAPPPVVFQAPAYDPNQPTPAATQIHGDIQHTAFGVPILSQPPHAWNSPISSTPSMATSTAVFTSANDCLNHRFVMEDDASAQAVADERVPVKDGIHHRLQREVLHIQARPESTAPAQPKATSASAPAKLTTVSKQGSFSCATTSEEQARAEASISKDMPRAVLDLKRRLDEQQARDRTSFETLQGELAKLTSMAAQLAISIGKRSTSAHNSTPTASASSASFLAPHVFGEMPTTIFLQETHGTGPVHHNPTQSTSVGVFANPGAGASLVTPLNPASVTPVQSTFLADENNNLTEQHPYEEDCFTKSEQQPQHGSSIGFCTVLPTNLIIQQDREGKQKTEDTSNYFTKTIFSPERAAVCSASVFSLKIEEIICDSEKMNDSDNQFLAKQHIDQLLHCSSTAPQCSTYEEECQGDENILWVKSVCQTSTGNSISFYQWDPGDTKLHDLFSVAAVSKKIPSTHAYKCVRVQILVGQFGASREPSFTCATMHPYAFGLGCKRVNALVLIVLAVQGSTGRSVAKPLLFLANDGNSSTKHSSPKLFMHIYLDTRAMQTFPWLQNPLLTDLQCQLPMFNSSELLQHVVNVLSSWFPSFEMDISQVAKLSSFTLENVAPLAGSSVTGFNRYTCLSFWVQYKFYVLWKSEIGMTTCISWDPGIRHYMAPNGIISVHQDNSFIMLRAAHFSECKYPCSLYCKCMLKTEYCPSRCLSEISVSCLKRLQWNPGDFTHMLLVLCVSCREITDNCFADLKLMANTSSKLAALTWPSSLSGTPFLLLSSTTYTWEPGVQCIIDRLLDKFIEQQKFEDQQESEPLAKCFCMSSENASSEQVQFLKPLSGPELNIGCSLKLNTGNCIIEFWVADSTLSFQQERQQNIQIQECHMMLITEGIQDWDPGIGTTSSMYLWLQGLTALVATSKPLPWLQISELATWRSQVASASYVWDPD